MGGGGRSSGFGPGFSRSPSRVCTRILLKTFCWSVESEHRYSAAWRALTFPMTRDEEPLLSTLLPTAHSTLPPTPREEVLWQESDSDSPTEANTSSTPSEREAQPLTLCRAPFHPFFACLWPFFLSFFLPPTVVVWVMAAFSVSFWYMQHFHFLRWSVSLVVMNSLEKHSEGFSMRNLFPVNSLSCSVLHWIWILLFKHCLCPR